jgi:hypothetical protein
VTTRELDRLPDPELFRDALMLADTVSWSPAEMDATDALLYALIHSIRNARRG